MFADSFTTPEPQARGLSHRERFLRACRCQAVDRPPMWLMRQAGRALPEYRELKKTYSFLELVQTPALATEVTLQPIRRFGFDAAILFSDILVIAEALGQPYRFHEEGGIEMEFLLKTPADIARLDVSHVVEKLGYVDAAVRSLRRELGQRTALIGFAGSPWTLANFMLEGAGVREYTAAKALFFADQAMFEALMEKLTLAVSAYLEMQIDAGVDAVQIFDSLGGLLGDSIFEGASAKWMKAIINHLRQKVPVIVFSKGVHGSYETLQKLGAQVLGMDWTVNLGEVRKRIREPLGLQGNLDPFFLSTHPAAVQLETTRILESMRGRDGYIFNLGHGVPPSARLENIAALVATVKDFKG